MQRRNECSVPFASAPFKDWRYYNTRLSEGQQHFCLKNAAAKPGEFRHVLQKFTVSGQKSEKISCEGHGLPTRKKLCGFPQSFLLMLCSDRAGNFTGTQAPGTNIHMARRTIDQSLHALDVGLPGTIGTTMRVGNLDTKGHALIAELALSHPLHLLAVVTSCLPFHKQ